MVGFLCFCFCFLFLPKEIFALAEPAMRNATWGDKGMVEFVIAIEAEVKMHQVQKEQMVVASANAVVGKQ